MDMDRTEPFFALPLEPDALNGKKAPKSNKR